MRMRWLDLLFAHWPVDADALRPHLPPSLELDTFDGQAWLGIVPFRMADVGPRGLPAPPVLGAFPELNVRTYVTHEGRSGVWFLSLDAASRLTVEGARLAFHLPYALADMTVESIGGEIYYRSTRIDARMAPATFSGRYRPTGPVQPAAPGSFDAWSTERWWLFAVDGAGRLERTEIRHAPWPLQPATAELDASPMATAHGLALPDVPPRLRFAARVDVRAWWPRRA
jgi:uncharacterized protein YqjF (DUF2071 family)